MSLALQPVRVGTGSDEEGMLVFDGGSAKSWRRSDGMKRRIVGVFEPPLLHQRSDTPCLIITSSSWPSQTALPIL